VSRFIAYRGANPPLSARIRKPLILRGFFFLWLRDSMQHWLLRKFLGKNPRLRHLGSTTIDHSCTMAAFASAGAECVRTASTEQEHMPNLRGMRQDIPAWSVRAAGFSFKSTGGDEA
jgi:hypothetical protein